ncbi:Hypothetical_protein [Hexamita inflata]|uniref:Hypothetical_protein n=1 Tax=Hexamita inflata TaxID=28002 RepID=A0AA86Q4L5_9EUKA|nr:Hypothetical protein HINF_LOCUS38728 [Hexamita inflata]
MIEKRAFMQETQDQFLKEQQDKIIQEKLKKEKIEKEKRDKEEKEKKKKDDDDKFEKEKREQIERDQNMFGQFERFGKGVYEELSNMIKVKSEDTKLLTDELKQIKEILAVKRDQQFEIGNMLHYQTNFIVSEIQRHKTVDDLKESLQNIKVQNEIRQKNIEKEKNDQIKTLLKIKQYDPKQIETCDKSIMILENSYKEIVNNNTQMTDDFQKLIDIKRNQELNQNVIDEFHEKENQHLEKIQQQVQQIESEKQGIQNYVKTISFSNEYDTKSFHIQSEQGNLSSIAHIDEDQTERVQVI